jgi:curved DNA-binding protein CbpA
VISDPYRTLGVRANATDAEIRAAYHRLVLHCHPDHNSGSPESARKFEEVQEAYARVRELRARRRGEPEAVPGGAEDPGVDAKLANLERQVREAQTARERAERKPAKARREARIATTDARRQAGRASDEQLGYVTTDDSFGKILSDARTQLSQWLSDADDVVTDAREHPTGKRISDLIDELEGKLRRGRPD